MSDTSFEGAYVARIDSDVSGQLTVVIPQVFQDASVPLDKWVGGRPQVADEGFVVFINGEPTWPVWLGAQLGQKAVKIYVGDSPPVGSYELWYEPGP